VASYYYVRNIIRPDRDYKSGNLRQDEMYRVIGTAPDRPLDLMIERVGTKELAQFNLRDLRSSLSTSQSKQS